MSTTPDDTRKYTVVVGLPRRRVSAGALRWALTEARAHRGTVYAVRAWRVPRPSATGTRPPLVTADPAAEFEIAEKTLVEDVRAVVGDADVVCRLVHGSRRDVLVDASVRADLLVVAAPQGTDPLAAPRLVQRLVHEAACPVVVVPLGVRV